MNLWAWPGNLWTMERLRELIEHSSLLLLINFITKSATAIMFILIARHSGSADAGLYALGVTYTLLILALLTGLEELLIREVSRQLHLSKRYLVNYLALRLALTTLLYLALVAGLTPILHYPPHVTRIVRLMALSAFPDGIAAVGQAICLAHGRLRLPAFSAFISTALKISGGMWLLVSTSSLEAIAVMQIAGSGLNAVTILAWSTHILSQGKGDWRLSWQFCRRELRLLSPFVLMGVASAVEYQADVIILSVVRDETSVAWYRAATTILLSLALLAAAFRAAIYPLMTRVASQSLVRLKLIYERSVFYLLMAVLPMAAGISLVARQLLFVLYGPGFEASVPVLRVIIWALVFIFLAVPNTRVLLALDRQRWASAFISVSVLTNVLLNVLLTPTYGETGAAVARLASTTLYVAMSFVAVYRLLKPSGIWLSLLRLMPPVLLMICAVWAARTLPLLVTILLGAVIYGLLIWATRAIPSHERSQLQQLVRSYIRVS